MAEGSQSTGNLPGSLLKFRASLGPPLVVATAFGPQIRLRLPARLSSATVKVSICFKPLSFSLLRSNRYLTYHQTMKPDTFISTVSGPHLRRWDPHSDSDSTCSRWAAAAQVTPGTCQYLISIFSSTDTWRWAFSSYRRR